MKSSPELVRQQNSGLVLSALRRHGRLAHTEISEETGLSSATVSVITSELERVGILERTELQALSGRGRPRLLFEPRRDCGYLIIAIISSDSVQYSLVDYRGHLIDRFLEQRGPELAHPERFASALRTALQRLVSRSKLDPASVLAISISSKGIVERGGATLAWSAILGSEPIDFSRLLEQDFPAHVMLANETLLVASALGERITRSDGDRKQDRNIAALSLGHSIGLGIYQCRGGQVSVDAPNFGHMLHMPGGALCRCGSTGCIEAYAGFYAILRGAFEVPQDMLPAKFVPLSELDKIAASARSGNRVASFAFRQAGLVLGNGLSRAFSLYGMMPVTVTGPGLRYFDLMQKGLQEGLAQAQIVRMEGQPQLTIVAEEQTLVFEGHLHQALSAMDLAVLRLKSAAAA